MPAAVVDAGTERQTPCAKASASSAAFDAGESARRSANHLPALPRCELSGGTTPTSYCRYRLRTASAMPSASMPTSCSSWGTEPWRTKESGSARVVTGHCTRCWDIDLYHPFAAAAHDSPLFGSYHAAGFGGGQDGLLVQGLRPQHVHHTHADTFIRQHFCRFQGTVGDGAERQDAGIGALSQQAGLSHL